MKIKLIHGFTQNRATLLPFCDLLGLIARCDVEVVEAPHHGDSPLIGTTLSEVADEISRLNGAQDQNCVFIGYSLGGRILLEALASRAITDRPVIVFGAAIDEGGQEARTARLEADRKLADRISRLESKEDFRGFLKDWLSAPLFNGISPDQAQLEARLSNDPKEIAKVLIDLSTGNQVDLMDRLRVALTESGNLGYIYGGDDAKFKAIATSLKAEIPQVSTVEIEKCGHFTIGERPFESALAIVGLLRSWELDVANR